MPVVSTEAIEGADDVHVVATHPSKLTPSLVRGEATSMRASPTPIVACVGVTCTDAGPGSATVAMTLGPEHLNFNGSCHGGVVFALADTAFGLAANSHGNVAAGIDAHITYQQAAQAGDRLVARAFEVSRSRKIGVYRVDVTRDDGRPISSFTGTVYITRDAHARAAAHGPQDEAAALSTTATAPAKPG